MNRQTCPYFEELDAVLGTRVASAPVVLLESAGTSEESNDRQEIDDDNTEVSHEIHEDSIQD